MIKPYLIDLVTSQTTDIILTRPEAILIRRMRAMDAAVVAMIQRIVAEYDPPLSLSLVRPPT